VATCGAEPLFFLDYFACGRLDVDVAEKVVAGIAEGCRQAGCALLGGETAELPGFYPEGEYDLAGFAVGVVEKGEIRDGRAVAVGDRLIALASSGLHSNGHSLARKVLLETLGLAWDGRPPELGGETVADALLRPTRIYVKALRALDAGGIGWKGAAHITGGGLVENPGRFLPPGGSLALRLDLATWAPPPVFALIAKAGVEPLEMRRTFNLGVGMLVCVPAPSAARAVELLTAAGERAWIAGEVVARAGDEVVFS
jgi:phosphoribosylformylglycinamidine cyclo-ligase